ncbi:insulinase family protein [Polynucleobacter sp. 30F-ANTBAC]|uniref:M16 family metallopeptidase n=1 Tax=Polynucleobacter sp. 30F-ANTBAC TaxID=2689095 RepID=UPI001C0DA90A|nr:pitrilysin family protein [Polynucleobacter sp. 30F-ANTBAC]MBU3600181.1 insulinase family protein [Polynucleobacter sp. 30F-ANTBAC]
MKKYIYLVLCALLPISAFAGIPIQHWTHSNGAQVYLVEAKTIPMLDVQVDWFAGAVGDPDKKLGLASMTATLIDKGSKVNGRLVSEADISDQLASLGASLSFSAGAEKASMRLRTLSDVQRRDALVKLASEILKAPLFDQNILMREKSRAIAAIKESNLKPEFILSKEFDRQIYGGHPFGKEATVETVQSIAAADIQEFYKSRYAVQDAKITIVGDIGREDADQLIDRLMSSLPKKAKVLTQAPEVKLFEKKSPDQNVIKIPHAAQQAHISIGMPTITRKDPDYFPMLLGNYVLGGGGFVSRLMKEVREKRGLAYSVYSYIAPGRQVGPFVAGMQTKKDQAELAVDVMKKTIADFIDAGPTESEIEAAKNNLINGFPLRIDSNRKILDNVASIAWNDLPLDTLETWTTQMRAVTREQVIAAYKKNLDIDKLVTVVVGAP